MDNEEDRGRLNMEKIKILAILPSSQEMQGDLFQAKLYSSDREGQDWLYSGLEGHLILLIDSSAKTKYLCLYDPITYQKLFQYELYKNFEKSLTTLANDFICFEIESGFIGFQFEKEEETQNFVNLINKIMPMKCVKMTNEDHKLQKEKIQSYSKILKETLSEGETKYDEKYAEDGTQISKHRNFKVLNNISYDNTKKHFKFGKISDELKEMFLSFGIKKKDLENDLDFAFTLFKKVIVGLGSENKLKNSALDSIAHTFLPPSEREKMRKQEEAAELKLNTKKLQRIQTKKSGPVSKPAAKKPTTNVKTNANTKASIKPVPKTNTKQKPPAKGKAGAPPPPPPPVPTAPTAPAAPKTVPQAAATTGEKTKPKEPELSREAQLKNVVLKKVVVKKEENKDKNIGGEGKNFLQNALSTAIRNRRQNLHMHDDDNDDDDDDDWD